MIWSRWSRLEGWSRWSLRGMESLESERDGVVGVLESEEDGVVGV